MFFLRLLTGVSSALAAVLIAATAWAADLRTLVTNLTTGGFGDRENRRAGRLG
jgi:urea transport system permease protein